MRVLLFVLGWAISALYAQQPNQRVYRQPDCVLAFSLAGAPSQNLDNTARGCNSWVLTYWSVGITTEIYEVQRATAIADGSAGAWSPMVAITGSNPFAPAAYGTATFSGWAPWVRVTQSGGGAPAPGAQFIGSLLGWADPDAVSPPCALQAPLSLSAVGNTEVIPAVAGQSIRVCAFYWNSATAQDIQITAGTGAHCGTGTVSITGLFRQAASLSLSPAFGFRAAPGQALCVNQGAAVNSGGIILYDRR